jgi:adenylate cyclase
MAFAQSNGFSLKTSLLFPAIALVTTTTAFSVACLGFFFFQWQEATLESHRIEGAKQTLGLFARQAAFPLAADDHLVLESLFRTGPLEKPLLYLAIANEHKAVLYHSDADRVGTIMVFPVGPDGASRQGPFELQSYRLETGAHVLDLSIPVTYRHAILGFAHLGLSLDDFRKKIEPYGAILFRRFLFGGMGLLGVSVISGILFALTLSRIIDKKRDRQGAPLPEMAGARFSSIVPVGQPENEAQDLTKAPSHSSRGLEKMADFCLPKGSSPDKFVRNHVTVLSAGVRGFRSLADDKNASEALCSLNSYFAIADDIIQEHGGVIDKFIGDALIGVFGGSPLNPDHSERAVRCALALQKALHKAGEDGNPIMRKIGIGISSGVVISARMGPRSREECAFLGESFKLAYSLNVMAGPGEILISKDVYRKIEGRVSVRPVPPREIMERTEPWEIFRFQSFTEDEGRN